VSQAVLGIVMTMVLPAPGEEAEREITRSTIDGGGVMHNTGGEIELSGTIGQPDGGVMTGGEFDLSGGFWFDLPPTDCNEDGLVSLLDHETFTACLAGPGGGIDSSPCTCFGVDGDGDVTLSDHAKLQAGFTGQ
jgi:hypothetical protein